MTKLSGVVAACAALSIAMSPLVVGSAVADDPDNDPFNDSWASAAHEGADRGGHHSGHGKPDTFPGGYKHLVVIYQENHSFDNLYGDWGEVNGQEVVGLSDATPERTLQVDQQGSPYVCLLQNDVNLTSPSPLETTCTDPGHKVPASHFTNRPFSIDDVIRPEDTTCAKPGESAPPNGNGVRNGDGTGAPGGCTRDLVHRFYHEQYQLNSGLQNRYVTGSDAVGLAMGVYDTKALPIYRYLHSEGAPRYVVADHFFQAAFGGSFLNHQWLIAARSPLDTSHGGFGATNSVLDANGMVESLPLYTRVGPTADRALTQNCPEGTSVDDPLRACGDFAVNTIQPSSEPFRHPPTGRPPVQIPLIDDAEYPNIGDRMSEAGISWNWYAGKWDDVNADRTSAPLFQEHHQPFNYFANYAVGAPGRDHLRDETEFVTAVGTGQLPTVSFVKPYGAENEHPGYASEPDGSDHVVDLLRTITEGPQAGNTLVVVTYDEFGGQWDHVPPPGQGPQAAPGPHDVWGPGTRIPALVISRSLKHSGVDHTSYDTTSILATIERSFGLAPLSSRDAAVNDLSPAVAAGGRGEHGNGEGAVED